MLPKKFTYTMQQYGKHNIGIQTEYSIAVHYNAIGGKADNISHAVKGDIEIDGIQYQVKGYHATICSGLYHATNENANAVIDEYISMDAADMFIYGTPNGVGYVMTREEWRTFCHLFHGSMERESQKNTAEGEKPCPKFRLKREPKAMMEWLENMARG